MKKLLFILSILIFISGCSEDTPTDTTLDTDNASEYYPGEIGTQFFYLVDTLDAGTQTFLPYGSRTASILSKSTQNNVEYYKQRNLIEPSTSPDDVDIYFRRSGTGVYFYVDTLGLGDAILAIDDSLASLLQITTDPEINVFSTPLEENKTWDAFKLNVEIPTIGFTLSVVELSASYEGTEMITTPATSGLATEAAKIKYTITLRIPDNPANPFSPTPRNYEGYGWYIQNVGLAMVEGNGVLVNALAGGEFNLDDTLSVYRETLNSYTIK